MLRQIYHRRRRVSLGLGAIVGLAAFAAACAMLRADGTDARASAPERVSFNEHIRPIFAKHCVACHGGVKQASGVSFIYRDIALAESESGLTPISPGDPDSSYLLDRVTDPDDESRMPPAEHGPRLSEREIALLRQWIEEGAEWELHWAFVAPKPQETPVVKQSNWPRAPLDNFILAKLEAAGLEPAAEADRAAWLRRVSLDLIGLPPSPEEYAEFESDKSPEAYEHVVDRLLASPHYGERWAGMWLDLARYADTKGYEADTNREAWPYRDWLIRALNQDMPFDQFTVEQLAGDLLPGASLEDRLATAFHRNTQTNTEGGTDDEEFRTIAVIDRVNTTWQVWQATTFGCTQCHSHPYDPIRHEEFYKFVALFNSSRDEDVPEDWPTLKVPDDPALWEEAAKIDSRSSEIRSELFARQDELAKEKSLWRPLRATGLAATGSTQLVVRDDVKEGVPEVWAEGTITANGTFTLEFPLEGIDEITAVRIDALPKDVEAALKSPEAGFVVSRLTGHVVGPDGTEVAEIEFAAVFADEPEPLLDPEASLRDDEDGWGDYSRMSHASHAVFLPKSPVAVPLGGRLRLAMKFDRTDSGGGALCIQRGRYAVSDSERWTALESDAKFTAQREELAALAKRRGEIGGTGIPVMSELPDELGRPAFLFERGNWLNKAQQVEPGVPAVMPPLAAGAKPDRLAMARWLASPENPLTARVMANRLWQQLLGIGIVETAEDFGTSGTLPSHPELLDHLALRLEHEHQWSVKRMLRELVLSAMYRQSGNVSAEKLAADSRNRLLSRGPRTRLSAEMLRDQALALSGRLSKKMYGKPVMPPQPEGVWRSVYNGAQWKVSEGEDRYRRAVYTFWKRTSGYPSLLTFDMPARDVCVVRRIATNTPLQALVTLNDPAYVELAQGFAERMAGAGGEPAQQIAAGYRIALGREIDGAKLERLVQLYNEAAAAFDAEPEAAKPLGDTREKYGLTVVANAMLNLDELLTK